MATDAYEKFMREASKRKDAEASAFVDAQLREINQDGALARLRKKFIPFWKRCTLVCKKSAQPKKGAFEIEGATGEWFIKEPSRKLARLDKKWFKFYYSLKIGSVYSYFKRVEFIWGKEKLDASEKAYRKFMEAAGKREDPESRKHVDEYFKRGEVERKDAKERRALLRKKTLPVWKKCVLIFKNPKEGEVTAFLKGGWCGVPFMKMPTGEVVKLKADWVFDYLYLFGGKSPEKIFKKVVKE